MITTTGKAKVLMCPIIRGVEQRCTATECMMWRFWVPPPGTESEWARNHPPETENDKKGYCGMSGQY